MIEFISVLDSRWNLRKPVWVEMEKVEAIDYGGIVVMLSVMLRFKALGIRFNGDFPANAKVRSVLEASGFFEQLELRVKNKSNYRVDQGEGIVTHASKRVDAALYNKILSQATRHIWGKPHRCQGAQRVIIELTQNTNNHASPMAKGQKHWFLSVFHTPDKRVAFSLVDYGVGVFSSLRSKTEGDKFFGGVEKLLLGYRDKLWHGDTSLLDKILSGELHRTASRKYYRGKGLPGVKHMLERGAIVNLNIITNSVKANVGQSKFESLPKSFHGTFVYWELDQTVEHCSEDET